MSVRKPVLFLIRPGPRPDYPEGWYCPDCAIVEGVLAYYPQLGEAIDVRHVDFPRPRRAIVDLAGEAFQDCPCLLLDPQTAPADLPLVNGWRIIIENTRRLLDTLPLLADGVGRSGKGTLF